MALDAALLQCAEGPTLRFYTWDPPAISLGHFQRDDRELTALRATGLPLLRRITGGGAIIHWHELTYCLVLPLDHPLLQQPSRAEIYGAVHAPFRRALQSLGLRADPRAPHDHAGASPTRCFDRATDIDLVCNGLKLMGSAQRRTRTHLLQHGSLILRTNEHQRDTAAVEDVLGRSIDARALAEAITAECERELGPLLRAEFSERELSFAADHPVPEL